jgi:uncharacterized phage-associated protein
MATVFDFAARIQSRLGQVDRYRLNKLVYYVQAWSLVFRSRPAFSAKIEAWADGPVAKQLWIDLKHNNGAAIRGAAELSTEDDEVVAQVLIHFGHLTSGELIKLTHDEDPWRIARGPTPPGAISDAEITIDSMKDYYTRTWKAAMADNEAALEEPAFVGSVDDLARHVGL